MPEKHRQMGEWTPDRFIRWAESRRIVVLGFRSTFRVWAMEHVEGASDAAEAALAHQESDRTKKAYQPARHLRSAGRS